MSEELAGHGVDLFGLDEFGEPVGMKALWGMAIGGGIATGTAIAIRAFNQGSTSTVNYEKWSEGIGFVAGAVASGVMMAFEGTRHAGIAGLTTAFLTNGLRQIERLLTDSYWDSQATSTTAGTRGIGVPVAERLNGVVAERLNGVVAERLNGRGLGVAVTEPVRQFQGVAGTRPGNQPPVNLMGPGRLPRNAAHVGVMGNPPLLHGLGSHFGATVFGGG
jgi:hypothetical protein